MFCCFARRSLVFFFPSFLNVVGNFSTYTQELYGIFLIFSRIPIHTYTHTHAHMLAAAQLITVYT